MNRALASALAVALIFPAAARAETLDQLKAELNKLESEVQVLRHKIEAQENAKNVQSPPAETATKAAASSSAERESLVAEVKDEVLKAVQATSSPAPAAAAANAFNPAISLAIDQVMSYSRQNEANYEFRSGEIGISSNIDPFAKGYAFINATGDGVEVEEAAVQTTSLPHNLQLQAGRFFASFNRLAKFHEHDLPTVTTPLALDEFLGGEAQADGVELSYLLPIDHYVGISAGAFNKLGADNTRVSNDEPRKFDEFTYIGRVETSFNLSDEQTLDMSGSLAFTPSVAMEDGASRRLWNAEVTYRYTPLASASYEGILWSTEYLFNSEDRPEGGFAADTPESMAPLQLRRVGASGMYSYAELKLTRRWVPGFMFERAEDINGSGNVVYAYSPYLSCYLSEFNRLRLQYSHLEGENGKSDDRAYLQWTVFLGSHEHGFKNR